MFLRNCLLIIISFFSLSSSAQQVIVHQGNAYDKKQWIDSIYNRLSTDERIGQLFMVPAYSGGPDFNQADIENLIFNHQVGGLIFMQGGPVRQAALTNRYQQMAQVPLLIAMDAEWGLGMRLDSVINFPKQMMLGATNDSALMYQVGAAVAYQCRRLGVHINFAPVVDVNNNPLNPVINMRSFGQDKTRVARLGIAYMKGMQNNGVIACAKHFPGHGDTETDSHKDLPIINKSLAQLDTLELYPFKELIQNGVKSIMIAHLEIAALETMPHVPTTLSENTVSGLLKNRLGFKGLVFTDALVMKGVAKYFSDGDAELKAFEAGNDILLIPQNVPAAIGKIKIAVQADESLQKKLEQSVKKILAAKYDVGLQNRRIIDPENIVEDLNKSTEPLRKRIATEAFTLVRDDNKLLQKLAVQGTTIGYVGVNATTTALSDALLEYMVPEAEWLPKGASNVTAKRIMDGMSSNDVNIVAVHNLNMYPAHNYGLDASQMSFLEGVQNKKNVLFVVMGNPYFLNNFCDVHSAIVAYDDDSTTQKVLAEFLAKKKPFRGNLPVSICAGKNIATTDVRETNELPLQETPIIPIVPFQLTKATNAREAGVTSEDALNKLDAFIHKCINDGAFPGCRILAAKNGKIFYDSSFGYFDYTETKPVNSSTIYDVASMTKVLATNLVVMKLYEENKLSFDKTVGDYLPYLKGTDKGNLKIKNLLLHQAGLKSWIPFYKETIDESGGLKPELYRTTRQKDYTTQVAKNLFLRNDYKDTVWNRIISSPLENTGRYVYSDLDFYFLAAIAEQLTQTKIERYTDSVFYHPLGLKSTFYNPLDKSNIAPTENDEVFRHQQLCGYVHDQGAALLGGVAGHAGIFSSAGDVATIFQMLMNYGAYNGKRFFKRETIEKFIAYNSSLSRRGLGFDKPNADKNDAVTTSNRSSGYTFGHQGFTGTCVWSDPANGVMFVFLSNRVCPNADNNLINKLDVRTTAQDYIYEALGIPVNTNRAKLKQRQMSGK